MRALILLALPLLLAACQQDDNAPGVGGVTTGEARALNQAAAALEDQAAIANANNAAFPADAR